MAGFKKAKGEQAALKMGVYGPPGSGKTFTSLLLAEGLAALSGKRVAFVDTERGTDFYAQAVPSRRVHPEAFDFDALYTRSLTEVLKEVQALKTSDYGVLIIDSFSHIWEAAINAYSGAKTKIGSIPMHAWGKIKAPYKQLVNHILSSPLHVIICGRQGVEYGESDDGELKAVGVKFRAEGETPYEPHILIRMEAVKSAKTREAVITAFVEKDRTGVLAGQTITGPCFDNLAKPLLGLLGHTQAKIQTEEETGAQDAEALMKQEREREAASKILLQKFVARFQLAGNAAEVEKISKEITPEVKKQMLPADVAACREAYQAARNGRPVQAEPVAAAARQPGEDE